MFDELNINEGLGKVHLDFDTKKNFVENDYTNSLWPLIDQSQDYRNANISSWYNMNSSSADIVKAQGKCYRLLKMFNT